MCLEITETAIVESADRAQTVINGLRQLGISISVDDFGVGHSSLAQLTRLGTIDELKIDKRLIDDVDSNPATQRVVQAIVDIAVGTDLNVVAEGVETQAQVDQLRCLGCTTIQGFLFSPAFPPHRFLDYVRHGVTDPSANPSRTTSHIAPC